MQARPQGRSNGVVIKELAGGVVIYDSETGSAHSLDPVAKQVFAAADGTRTPAQVGLDEECVRGSLDQLGARGLLARV